MYRTLLVIFSAIAISTSSLAVEETKFDMEVQNGKLSEAVKLVNGLCEKKHGALNVDNPDKELSLKFESISCTEALNLLKDYDQGAA